MAALIVPPWLHEAHRQGFERYVRSGHELAGPSTRTVLAARADGTTTPRGAGAPARRGRRRHRTVAILMRDVAGQPAHEEPIPALLEALFARAPEIITLVDNDSRQFNVNDAAARLLGWDSVMQRPGGGLRFRSPGRP